MHIPRDFVIPVPEGYVGHTHFWERALTRRQFIGTSVVVGGAAVTAPLWSSAIAEAAALVDPKPIPQTIAPGAPFHAQFLGTNTEPSSITDFKGIIGGVDLLGTGVGTDTKTGAQTKLFTAMDNRFMQGVYVGVDGKQHHATFGFVWLDIFTDAARQNQIHDFNLDIRPFPGGVFWTNFIQHQSVAAEGDFEDGARLDVDGLNLFDYFNVKNALSNGNSIAAKASYSVRWSGDGTPLTIDDGANFHFNGRQTKGFISWSAREAGFSFESDPAQTTTTNFALVGRERNGKFYRA